MNDQASRSESGPASAQGSSISRFTPAPKSRSCVVCRSRKVRCDKLNPCSNCRKADVACVFPASDRPPKWVRRLERITKQTESTSAEKESSNGEADQVLQRLRSLEGLVKELSGQLEQANAASPTAHHGSSTVASPGSSDHGSHIVRQGNAQPRSSAQDHFGRLVVQDKSQSRYVSSGFWSRMKDELDSLKMATQGVADPESDSSDNGDAPSRTTTQESARTPSERHDFFFRHNLASSSMDLREFRPLPSQIPFLLDTYAENVNYVMGIVHMPTVRQMVRNIRGSDTTSLSPANEALLFSIYYAAVTSMEDEDVINNFGTTKSELNLKYRLGLEHSLARADFLNVPDLVLVQAFVNFLCLARRHDSPRFIWMMTGLLIRMGQALGLQRDGSRLGDLTPYQVEMRRRLWWAICMLDIRASEDQGSEITIFRDSFDTKLPSNIYDKDIGPDKKELPEVQEAITEVTPALTSYELVELVREMVAPGGKNGIPNLEEQSRLIDTFYAKTEQGHLRFGKDTDQSAYWMACIAALLVMSKMRLLVYLPVLFTSSNETFSEDIQNKLLVSAIEVAEWNHALNAEESVRQWRWVYQTYTHWYSIVYMLLEVARRPLLPIVERAWIALQSIWLIPSQSRVDPKNRHWVPLRKLMAKARSHREAELQRLRTDNQYAKQLERQNASMPVPGSSGPFPGDSADAFLRHWRNLIAETASSNRESATAPKNAANPARLPADMTSPWSGTTGSLTSIPASEMAVANPNQHQDRTIQHVSNFPTSPFAGIPIDWTAGQMNSPAPATPWLWSDTDIAFDDLSNIDMNMDLAGDTNWQQWMDVAKDLG